MERWRNRTIDNQQELGVRGGIATSCGYQGPVLGQHHQHPSSLSRDTHSSDRGRFDGGGSDSLAPLSNCRSRSTTPAPSMNGSAHSSAFLGHQGKCINRGPSHPLVVSLNRLVVACCVASILHLFPYCLTCPLILSSHRLVVAYRFLAPAGCCMSRHLCCSRVAFYRRRDAKLCAVHKPRSGPRNSKKICGFTSSAGGIVKYPYCSLLLLLVPSPP